MNRIIVLQLWLLLWHISCALSSHQVSQRRKDFPTLFYPGPDRQFVTLSPEETPVSPSVNNNNFEKQNEIVTSEQIIEDFKTPVKNEEFSNDVRQVEFTNNPDDNPDPLPVHVIYVRPGSDQSPSLFDNTQGFSDIPVEPQETQQFREIQNENNPTRNLERPRHGSLNSRRRPHALTNNGQGIRALRPYPIRLRLQDLVSPPSPAQLMQMLNLKSPPRIVHISQSPTPLEQVQPQSGFQGNVENPNFESGDVNFENQQSQVENQQQFQQESDERPFNENNFPQNNVNENQQFGPQNNENVNSQQFIPQNNENLNSQQFIPQNNENVNSQFIPRTPHLNPNDQFSSQNPTSNSQQFTSNNPNPEFQEQHQQQHQQQLQLSSSAPPKFSPPRLPWNIGRRRPHLLESSGQQQDTPLNSFPIQQTKTFTNLPQFNENGGQLGASSEFSEGQRTNQFQQLPQQQQQEQQQQQQTFINNNNNNNNNNEDVLDSFFGQTKTNFSCRDQPYPGYYADVETGCQMFHVCYGGSHFSFQCPQGTLFDQKYLVCNWPHSVICDQSSQFVHVNAVFSEEMNQSK